MRRLIRGLKSLPSHKVNIQQAIINEHNISIRNSVFKELFQHVHLFNVLTQNKPYQ